MQKKLARSALPNLPPDGRGRSLDRSGAASGGVSLAEEVELTEEETRILNETRARIRRI